MTILLVIYVALGYWATGVTIYANKIIIYKFGQLFMQKLIIGTFFGWILVPVAIIKVIFMNK